MSAPPGGFSRALVLTYAGLVYLLGVRAVAYMAGFLGNLVVPKTVDAGARSGLAETLAVELGLMVLFALSHSLTAREPAKQWLRRLGPPALERSHYVLLASLLLTLTFWQWRPLPQPVWHVDWMPARGVLWGLFALGWVLAAMSTHTIGHFELFGLRQAWRWGRGLPAEPIPLQTRLLYRWVRHPVYLGFLLGSWATPEMSTGHLLFAAVMTAYALIGLRYEERDLAARYGAAYQAYRAGVPTLLPRVKRR